MPPICRNRWSLALLSVYLCQTSAYTWPSPKYDALESLLYEGTRPDGKSISNIVNDCAHRKTIERRDLANANVASTVASEWLRFAYHDMATHNVDTGTGGIDGSIHFELDRAENVGNGMSRTQTDYQIHASKLVSKSDIIAIGTVMAVAACNGPIIPFRGGRIDAQQAGPAGVPEPHQDLASHTESFRRQGFTQSEMIGLVACGHTIGAVRSDDFPSIVDHPPDESDLPRNHGFFDGTDTTFDERVVTQYLDGTTQNPLVTHPNATIRSDLRIFISDRNVTMKSMATKESFDSKCKTLLERMINTVPRGVTLTEEIKLLDAKVQNSELTIQDGALFFETRLRLVKKPDVPIPPNRTVRLLWCDKYGDNADCKNGKANSGLAGLHNFHNIPPAPNAQRLGLTFPRYFFRMPIDPSQSISKFWFEVDEKDGTPKRVIDNGGGKYLFAQDQVLFARALGGKNLILVSGQAKLDLQFVVGVRESLSPTRVSVRAFDNTHLPAAAPSDNTIELKLETTRPAVAGYKFYSGIVPKGSFNGVVADVRVELDGKTIEIEDIESTANMGVLSNVPAGSLEIVAV